MERRASCVTQNRIHGSFPAPTNEATDATVAGMLPAGAFGRRKRVSERKVARSSVVLASFFCMQLLANESANVDKEKCGVSALQVQNSTGELPPVNYNEMSDLEKQLFKSAEIMYRGKEGAAQLSELEKKAEAEQKRLEEAAAPKGPVDPVAEASKQQIEFIKQGEKEGLTPEAIGAILTMQENNPDLVHELNELGQELEKDHDQQSLSRNQDPPFLQLIRQGRVRPFISHIRHGNYNVNQIDYKGNAALHYAATLKDELPMKVLVARQDANINISSSPLRQTPLHVAILHGTLAQLKLLLSDKRVEVNVQDKDGRTPLHVAVQHDNRAAFDMLLRMPSIEVNLQDNHGVTPLSSAVATSKWWMIKPLIGHGADPAVRDKLGLTALHLAVRQGDQRAVSLMLDAIYRRRLNLHEEFRNLWTYDKPENLLFSASDNLVVSDEAKAAATEGGAEEAAHVHSANIFPPEDEITKSAPSDDPINQQDSAGKTVLHLAAASMPKRIVYWLLRYGADPTIKDNTNHIPYDYAAARTDGTANLLASPANALGAAAAALPSHGPDNE